MNSFIPWVGGKGKLLWIINKMAPDHYSRFIDVFGGSGTVTNNGLLTVTGAVMPGGTNAIGTLALASSCPLSGELRVDVATNGVCDRLYVQGDLSVTNLALTVADTGLLNEDMRYVIANCSGAVSGPFASAALPRRWFVQYDAANRRVYLIYNRGTVLTLR